MHRGMVHANAVTSQLINFEENGNYFRNMYVLLYLTTSLYYSNTFFMYCADINNM